MSGLTPAEDSHLQCLPSCTLMLPPSREGVNVPSPGLWAGPVLSVSYPS